MTPAHRRAPHTACLLPVALAAFILLWAGLANTITAQPERAPASTTHRRVPGDRDTVLALADAWLFVPTGAVPGGTVVGLGAGGVPGPDGTMAGSGVVISTSREPRVPLVVMLSWTERDRALVGGGDPALLDTARGVLIACRDGGALFACPIERPGAYIVIPSAAPVPEEPLLARALAAVEARRAAPSGVPRARVLAIVILAAAVGAGAALLVGRSAAHEARMCESQLPSGALDLSPRIRRLSQQDRAATGQRR